VAALLGGAADEDAARGRLVDGVGGGEVARVDGGEVRLEHPVDADDPLDALLRRLRRFQQRHELDEGRARRLRLVGGRAQLREPPAPRVRVLRALPHVPSEQELHGQLGRERDPAAQDAHEPLLGVAVVPDAGRGGLDRELAGERMRGHGARAGRQ
jgi:hypothetical protein